MAAAWRRRQRQRQAAHFSPPFRSVAQQYALANQTLIARWMKAVIIIERKEIAPIMTPGHRLRTPRGEIVFTAWPNIQSQSQMCRYGGSIFCPPHWPDFSDIFNSCLHWVSVVRAPGRGLIAACCPTTA